MENIEDINGQNATQQISQNAEIKRETNREISKATEVISSERSRWSAVCESESNNNDK